MNYFRLLFRGVFMQIHRKDIGYTIYSRLEEALRFWISDKLEKQYGDDWARFIPLGLWEKTVDVLNVSSVDEIESPIDLLDELNIPDLLEIITYKKSYSIYLPSGIMKRKELEKNFKMLYEIRNKIAHVKRSFSAFDLDLLINIAYEFLKIEEIKKCNIKDLLECIQKNPQKVVVQVPNTFFIDENKNDFKHITNLPESDYDPDGGFIGRQNDINKITKYLLSDQDRVITISGAGGVGKSAVAHKICSNMLMKKELPFDAIVWVSAKEEKLTISGIETIDAKLKNYESVLDSILESYKWYDEINTSIKNKEECVQIILRAGEKGLLLVVDNLETIVDERVIDFIKDIPRPSKVLITSRIGLGEIERRYQLKEMHIKDAIILLRTISKEKGIDSLMRLPDEVLSNYVNKMSRYPLAIKWVIGQVAVGKDIDSAIGGLTESSGDVAKFCFEHIFNNLLTEDAKLVLYALAANQKPLVRGVLSHLTNLPPDRLDKSLKDLTKASLIIPTQRKTVENTLETKYELLPLTCNFIQSKLQSHSDIHREIKRRTEMVQNLIEEADRAGKQYRYSLSDMGAQSDEEKIAATWANTAYQKYQAGDYDGSVEAFRRAIEIAPYFPALYRNWATMESEAGFYEKADKLMVKATKLDPNDSRLWFVWGNIEKRRQRYDKAFDYLSKALKISPNDAPILGALGEIEKRRGNFKQADILLRKALEGSFSVSHRRHQIICYTALADNLRRWSESLNKDRQVDETLRKLREGYEFACKAKDLDKDDYKAHYVYLQICKDYAISLLRAKGLEVAKPFFDKAITKKPQKTKERKINCICCLYLANQLINSNIEEAKKYYNIGKKSLFPGSGLFNKYKELGLELYGDRYTGKLYDVNYNRGFGFIELNENTGQSIFVHISDFVYKITNDEFYNMKNQILSFNIEKNEKGFIAKRVRTVEN